MKKEARPIRTVKHDPLYMKHWRWLVTVVTTIVFLLSMTLFAAFERVSRKIVFDDAITLLEQTADSTSDLMDTCIQITTRIQSDVVISPILYHNNADPGEIAQALSQLSLYRLTVQSIDSIYVYSARTGKMYSSDGITGQDNLIKNVEQFIDQEALELINNYKDYSAYTGIPRTIGKENCYTFLGYGFKDKSDDGTLNSAVLVNVSADWLQNLVNIESGAGDTLILDSKGFLVSDTPGYPMLSNFAELQPEAASIIGAKEKGFKIIGKGDERLFIAYTAPDSMEWQYVRMIPYDTIIAGITRLRNLTFIIIFAFLVIGLLVSWYLNRILYKPINRYKEDISRLEEYERTSFATVKQAFLRRLLLSSASADTKRLSTLSPNLDPNKACYLALIKIDQYTHFKEIYSAAEQESYRYAVLNIGSEIAGQLFSIESVDLQVNRMVLILSCKETVPPQEELKRLLAEIRDTIYEHLSLSVSIILSGPGGFETLHTLYNAAAGNAFKRIFLGEGALIMNDDSDEMTDYRYPEKKEKLLTESLLKGNLDRAKQIYQEIIGECSNAPLYIFNTTVLRLVSMCNQVAESLEGFKRQTAYFINLGEIESITQLDEQFEDIFSAITDHVAQRGGSKTDKQVESINAEIESRYADQALSIESIADTLGLSASYTGRIYKQATGITILERILEVRMAHARDILESTDEPIAAVSEKTGFSSDSYFYKIFKQENGITPAAYRKKFSTYRK